VERPEIDLRSASVARIFDYYLGGAHNFAVDRELADAAAKLMPELPRMMQLHRRFLARAKAWWSSQALATSAKTHNSSTSRPHWRVRASS